MTGSVVVRESLAPGGPRFVSTRYQGSKQRALGLLERALLHLRFESVVDIFGGSASVSHLFKRANKRVHYNDALRSNQVVGRALIENSHTRLEVLQARALFVPTPKRRYDDFIERTFAGIYYTDAENRELDIVRQNIEGLAGYEKDLALYALFQACLKKRPYNLFHRKNLELRTRSVSRSFGNKTTWDTPLLTHVETALREANRAVFDNHHTHKATCLDADECPLESDLCYLDPPYVRSDGAGFDYEQGYHFLEGLTDYERWSERVDLERKHRPLRSEPSRFASKHSITESLVRIITRAQAVPIVAVSYRSDGIPSETELRELLMSQNRSVTVSRMSHRYALSKRSPEEIVVVGVRRRC